MILCIDHARDCDRHRRSHRGGLLMIATKVVSNGLCRTASASRSAFTILVSGVINFLLRFVFATSPLVSMAAGSVIGFVVMMLTISNRLDAPLPIGGRCRDRVRHLHRHLGLDPVIGLGAARMARSPGGTGGTTLILPRLT